MNLKQLFGLCEHQWDVVKEITTYSEYDNPNTDLPIYRKWVLECKKCGDVKVKKI